METAKHDKYVRYLHNAAYAASFQAFVGLGIVIYYAATKVSIFGTNYLSIADVILPAFMAWRIWRGSVAWGAIAVIYQVGNVEIKITEHHGSPLVAIIVLYFYAAGLWAALQLWRERRAEKRAAAVAGFTAIEPH